MLKETLCTPPIWWRCMAWCRMMKTLWWILDPGSTILRSKRSIIHDPLLVWSRSWLTCKGHKRWLDGCQAVGVFEFVLNCYYSPTHTVDALYLLKKQALRRKMAWQQQQEQQQQKWASRVKHSDTQIEILAKIFMMNNIFWFNSTFFSYIV